MGIVLCLVACIFALRCLCFVARFIKEYRIDPSWERSLDTLPERLLEINTAHKRSEISSTEAKIRKRNHGNQVNKEGMHMGLWALVVKGMDLASLVLAAAAIAGVIGFLEPIVAVIGLIVLVIIGCIVGFSWIGYRRSA